MKTVLFKPLPRAIRANLGNIVEPGFPVWLAKSMIRFRNEAVIDSQGRRVLVQTAA